MLPRADIVGTRPVASVEATRPTIAVGDAHQEVAQRLNRIALGSFLEGEVLSRLQDGSFTVKVADTAVRMNLPSGTQVGETLDLMLIATEPRPAFVLTTPTRDNTASLSSAGRLVDWIIHTAKAAGAPTALLGKTPLAPSADAKPAQVAASMKDTLEFSGLFYESHVAQWISGERPLTTLLQEPQAKNSNLPLIATALRAAASAARAAGTGSAPPNTTHLARLIENLGGHPDALRALMTMLHASSQIVPNSPPAEANAPEQPVRNPATTENVTVPDLPADAQTANVPAPDAAAGTELMPVPTAATAVATDQPMTEADVTLLHKTMSSESVNTVNLQLNTLEQQRIAWQGELWPGQQIEWEIGEETPQGKQADAQERAWQSVVRFEMPVLGKVSATVRLSGERLQIQVRAADEATASLLRAHGNVLGSALAAAGSPLDQLTVKRDETA